MCHFEASKSNARGIEKGCVCWWGGCLRCRKLGFFSKHKKVALQSCDEPFALRLSDRRTIVHWRRLIVMDTLPLSLNRHVAPRYKCSHVHVHFTSLPTQERGGVGAARLISGTFCSSSHTARRNISIPSPKLISLNEVSEWLIIMMNVLLQ